MLELGFLASGLDFRFTRWWAPWVSSTGKTLWCLAHYFAQDKLSKLYLEKVNERMAELQTVLACYLISGRIQFSLYWVMIPFFPPSLHGVSIFLIFSLWIDGSEKGLPAGPKSKSAKLVHILRDITGTFCLEQRLTLSWGQVNLH